MYGYGAHGKLTDSGDWRETIDLHTHRYMLEDTLAGPVSGVHRPLGGRADAAAQGSLNIASAITTGRDAPAEGRTLSAQPDRLSRAGMAELLEQGAGTWKTEFA